MYLIQKWLLQESQNISFKNIIMDIKCLVATQGGRDLVCFPMKAKELFNLVDINKRDPDKNTGYQRVLSMSRVESIAKYLNAGNQIPTCILISLDKPAELKKADNLLTIPQGQRIGWVIDGQHRLVGANQAEIDVEFFVVAFIDLPIEEQVRQFVTINNESKGVPTSLIYDLLMYMPANKTPAEVAQEQATEIANNLRKDEASPFYGKIAVVTSPKKGEISLTNFVRKVSPYIIKDKGKFNKYTFEEQRRIVDNYFKAIIHVFPELSDPSTSIIFQTIGFGAMMNALDSIFDYTILFEKGFAINDIIKTLKLVSDFQFSDWKKLGTGSAAEIQAGNDFKVSLELRVNELKPGTENRIRL